jgi:glycine dehydrogenase
MVTYPSTHGVFEPGIGELCAVVHDHGGQVYVDGANLNALVGLAQPGRFGADVSHLNLHKTFCIPHGGGGPGRRPGGRARPPRRVPARAPLGGPDQRSGRCPRRRSVSASILPISWVYIALMGAAGLRAATGAAVLNANYIATVLHPAFPCCTPGRAGRSGTSASSTCAGITKATGVTVDDVAKRLMDYGFHAPTMSFPVAGTLMIEPTESEDQARARPLLRRR